MQISIPQQKRLQADLKNMKKVRSPWWNTWRELSDYFLPRRYPWLLTDREHRSAQVRNQNLLDGTSIRALRTLATGMMNGITSPTRNWFRLRRVGIEDEQESHDIQVWLEESAKRMHLVMAESNFYNSIGILYLEWSCFGTAGMGIYEDFDSVIRCHNYAVGEFMIEVDYAGRVVKLGREFTKTVEQLVEEFGLENCSLMVQNDYRNQGHTRNRVVTLYHLCLPSAQVPELRYNSRFIDIYWEATESTGKLLRINPVEEFPNIAPRWETYGSDVYGSSPCMDALPDVKQLQHLIKRRAQGLDKMVSPPLLVNKMLESRQKSMLPGGHTYVSGNDLAQGARPVYQINVPFGELNLDVAQVREAIGETLFNDLFRMISQLDTVRSATEIDARREERLIQLGPVLERFESEGLSPCINRIFQICLRAGIFTEPPQALVESELSIQYVGVLSDAQRAIGTVPIERYLQLLGNMAPIFQDDVLDVPDAEEIFRGYAEAIGLPAKYQKSRDRVAEIKQARDEQRSIQQAAEQSGALIDGAQQLSETDMGGGQSALQALMGS